MLTKEQFLKEHNKLSPINLKATLAMVTRFQEEKKPLLKEDGWSIEKMRIPFITWMLSTATKEEEKEVAEKVSMFRNYPETHDI